MKLSNQIYQVGLVILFLFLPASLLYYANPLDHIPGTDNGVFLYGGQQLLEGKTPYLDFWDHKGPLIYIINALGLLLGKGSRWGVWSVEFIFLTLTATGTYQIARSQFGKPAGIVATLYWAYVLMQVGHYKDFNDSNYTESYSLLFNTLTIYFWVWATKSKGPYWGWFAMGIFISFSFLLRPNNIGVQLSIAFVELVTEVTTGEVKNLLKRILFLVFGILLVFAVIFVWFLFRGALSNLIDAVFTYNMYYSKKNMIAGFAVSYTKMVKASFNKLGWFPFAGYGIILFLWKYKYIKYKIFDVWHQKKIILMILVGLPLETVLSSVSGRPVYHYIMIWTPYLALIASVLTKELFLKITLPFFKKFGPFIFLAIMLTYLFAANFPVLEGYMRLGNRFLLRNNKSLDAKNAIVQYIGDVTEPDDTVLVWGNNVWINFMADRASPTKYSYQFPLFMPGYTTEAKVLNFLHALQTSPPVLIVEPQTDTAEMLPLNPEIRKTVILYAQVDTPKGMSEVFQYVNENYCIVKKFHDTIVYRLKSNLGCD